MYGSGLRLHGVHAPSRQGCRSRPPRDRGSRRQGRQGSAYSAGRVLPSRRSQRLRAREPSSFARDDAAAVRTTGSRRRAAPQVSERRAPSGVGSTCSRRRGSWSMRRGIRRRHHLHETVDAAGVSRGGDAARIAKRATCHSLRHSFATHLLESRRGHSDGAGFLGHTDLRTTMMYTHVLNGWVGRAEPGGPPLMRGG